MGLRGRVAVAVAVWLGSIAMVTDWRLAGNLGNFGALCFGVF